MSKRNRGKQAFVGVEGDEVGGNQNSVKESICRCSSTYFRQVMQTIEPILSDKQEARIKRTPFSKWLKMPKLSIFRTRVDVLLKRFDSESSCFSFGKDIVCPFTSLEFSVVLGLPHGGQQVDLDLKSQSVLLTQYFSGKVVNATRRKIYKNLLLLAESGDDADLDDFVKMYILFAFNCIVFPSSAYTTPRFIFSYIDDLPNFFDYMWGEAAHRFLCEKIAAFKETSEGIHYLDGCVVGMMAWVYEKVPSLGLLSGSPRTFPRLFKWSGSRIPVRVEDAEDALKKITRSKVLTITPFGDELELLGERFGSERVSYKMKEDETNLKIQRLERLVEEQRKEIERLKQIFCQKDGVIANENVPPTADVGVVEDPKYAAVVAMVDEGDVNDKDLGGCSERCVVEFGADLEGDGAGLSNLNVQENKIATNDSPPVVANDSESDTAPGVGGSGEDTVDNVISSIVKNVITRTDRVKKRKPDMFVTPPSSTSTRKTKSGYDGKEFTVINDSEEGNDSVGERDDDNELSLIAYKYRKDFCGCAQSSDEDRAIILEYLTQEKLGGAVWEGERLQLFGRQLCDLLFGARVRGDVINCYMHILRGCSRDNGFDIFFLETTVLDEVLNALQRANKKRLLKDDEYVNFLARLTFDSRTNIQQLTQTVVESRRFLLFPINREDHWFLLVYRTEGKKFELRNSINSSMALGTARVLSKFVSGYMRVMCGYTMGEAITRVNCRQQGADLDCGVYTCLWLQCYARDDKVTWEYEKGCEMNSVRARVAATILTDRHGLYCKDS